MNLIEKLKHENHPLIIYGAGVVAQALFHACRSSGINIEGFCDNNPNKTKQPLCNTPVIHTPKLKEKFPEAVFLVSAADIKDAEAQLKNLGYSDWHPGSQLLRDFDFHQFPFSVPMDFVEYAVSTAVMCHDNYLLPDKLFLRSLDVIVTERCSLKCRDCSNLMQYYPNPKDCPTPELMRDIDKFCSITDSINEFRVLGGEPFMNKDAHIIIKRLSEEPKSRRTVVYTNGTIVPTEPQIKAMQNPKTLFIITDYGSLSGNLNKLVERLEATGIQHYVQKASGWTDCSELAPHNRTSEQQEQIFRDCCAKNTFTLSQGKLYRCPFSANAARLNAIPKSDRDCVDIYQEQTIEDMKLQIKDFLFGKTYLETCDYCNGRSFSAPEIEPAIQIKKPKPYTPVK